MNAYSGFRKIFANPVIVVSLLLAWPFIVLSLHLLTSAYTSGDDGYTAFAALSEKGVWGAAKEMAVFQGRFYQLAVYPIAMMPYVAESVVVVNIFRVINFVAFFAAFLYLSRRVLGVRRTLVFAGFFFCLFETVGGSYNAFHGLPMWFAFGCGLVFFSIGLHIEASRTGKTSIWAFVIFGISLLTYEIVILYAPLFSLVSLYYVSSRSGVLVSRGCVAIAYDALKKSWPAYALVVAYLITYVVFRVLYPGTYTGAASFSTAAPAEMLQPIFSFSWHSLHLSFSSAGDGLLSTSAIVFAALGCAAVLYGLVSPSGDDAVPSEEQGCAGSVYRLIALATIAAYVVIPNVMFGFTERYRIWAGDGVELYLGSIFSALPFLLLLTLAADCVWRRLREFTPGRAVLGISFAMIFIAAYANAKNAESFFGQSEIMTVRWDVANWVASRHIKVLPNPSDEIVVCGDGFTQTSELPTFFRNADMIADADIYWSRYLSRKSGRSVRYVHGVDDQSDCTASLRLSYGQECAVFAHGDDRWTMDFASQDIARTGVCGTRSEKFARGLISTQAAPTE